MESYKFLELFGTGKPNTMGNKLYIIPIYVVFKWGTIDSILQRESFDSDGLNCPLYWNEEAEAMYSLAFGTVLSCNGKAFTYNLNIDKVLYS